MVGLIFDRDFTLSRATVRVLGIERAVQAQFPLETERTRPVDQAALR